MKKKILIASIFAALLLLIVPFTAVAAGPISLSSDAQEKSKEETSREVALTQEEIIVEIQASVDTLLLNYGDNLEISTTCQEAIAITNSINFRPSCFILEWMMDRLKLQIAEAYEAGDDELGYKLFTLWVDFRILWHLIGCGNSDVSASTSSYSIETAISGELSTTATSEAYMAVAASGCPLCMQ